MVKSRRVAQAVGVVLAAGLLFPAVTVAQQTAEEVYQTIVRPSGHGSRMIYENDRFSVLDPATGQRWDGLHMDLSHGRAPGTGYGGYVAVVRNVSGMDYCIRTVHAFEPGQRYDSIQAPDPGNYLLPAGEMHLVAVVQGLGNRRRSLAVGVAYWRPDRTRERACSDAAPAGLAAWESGFSWHTEELTFEGSQR